MWGSKQLKHIENNIVNEKKIIVSGHPRFELLNKKYQNVNRGPQLVKISPVLLPVSDPKHPEKPNSLTVHGTVPEMRT